MCRKRKNVCGHERDGNTDARTSGCILRNCPFCVNNNCLLFRFRGTRHVSRPKYVLYKQQRHQVCQSRSIVYSSMNFRVSMYFYTHGGGGEASDKFVFAVDVSPISHYKSTNNSNKMTNLRRKVTIDNIMIRH